MHPTKNDLAPAKRRKLTEYLNRLLSDVLDLKSQCKQAHWNVKGKNFIALHELFDKIATEVDDAADLIAERIVQLGDTAEGTVRVAAKYSRLKEFPLDISDNQKHVDALSTAIATFNSYARKGIDDTDAMGDAVTSDMLTQITRGLDKQLWFVESHLKEQMKEAQRKAG